MKPMPEPRRAARARQGARRVRDQGALGHQPRQPRRASPRSSRSSSRSRKQVLAHGMMPIIEPEVNIKSADRAAGDAHPARRDSQGARRDSRGPAGDAQAVASRPRPGLFDPLVDHPKVLRVVALSGGFSRARSVRRAGQEPRHDRQLQPRACCPTCATQQSDEEFDRTLGDAIDEIYQASTVEGAGLTLDEAEFDPIDVSAARADGAGEALSDQPAGRRRGISRPAEGGARAGRRGRVPASGQGRRRA